MRTQVEELARVTAVPGPKSLELQAEWRRYEAQTITWQAPVVWDRAEGVVVTDVDGNQYYDWTSGVLVTNVGHSHPDHVAAIQAQVGRLMNCYDFLTPQRIKAAREMVRITPPNLDKAFFLTTGSEAVEAASRVAKRATGKYEIITFQGAFHGRTYASLSLGGLPTPKKQYGPVMPGIINVPYPDPYRPPLGLRPEDLIDATFELMESQIRATSTGSLAAVLIEPYLGAAGFVFPPDGFLKRLELWARERGIIFILDEVQSSFGRTGKMFAAEWENLAPHLMAIGKGIGSGVPTSCLMAEADVIGHLGQGEMSSTCGGNPLSSAACTAVIEIMERDRLVENAARVGEVLKGRLQEVQEKSAILGDVRGRGLVIALEIVKDKKTKEPSSELTRKLIQKAAEKGLLIGSVGVYGNVLRVAPPLVITEEQAHRSVDILESALAEM